MSDNAFFLLLGTIISLAIGSQIVHQLKISRLRRQDYAWYCREHPSHVVNGRIHCCYCFCPRITIRSLLQRTYLRAHVCSQCGQTLYYSQE